MLLKSPVDLSPLLISPDEITPRDVMEFRGEVFRDGLVSRYEADAVFMINESVSNQCDEWNYFYVEALTDFTVHQMEPKGYVSVENGEWLIRQIQKDGYVKLANELELLINIIEEAEECPQFLSAFTLMQVTHSIISGEGALIDGQVVSKGVIGEAETELLRRVLYSVSGENNIGISRAEAEILFELNDNTVEAENHPAWNTLYVKAIANYLMAYSGYNIPDRHTAFKREEWINDTDVDVAGVLKQTFSSFGSLFNTDNYKEMFKSDHQRVEEAFAQQNAEREEMMSSSEKIDQHEAHWLVEKIGSDGHFHENERALLEFLKRENPQIHPSLQPLLDKVA